MQLTDRTSLVASGRNGFDLTHPSDCHVYLLDGGSELALVDAGCGLGVDETLRRIGNQPVSTILVTHAHADHCGGAAVLADRLGADIVTSPEVAAIMTDADESAASVDLGRRRGGYPADYRLPAADVARAVSDGDRVDVGKIVVEVISTPGHARGHLCFLARSPDGVDLFTGDTLFFGGRVIYQPTWDFDPQALCQSVTKLATYEVDGFFPGHWTFSTRNGQRHLAAAYQRVKQGQLPEGVV